MKKFCLVLGGGGAKGYAHIGVLKVLEENGIIPDLIVGTSAGALIGGMYASGTPLKEIEALASQITKSHIIDVDAMVLVKNNLLRGKKIDKLLTKIFEDRDMMDNKIKFVSVATNLDNGNERVLDSGKVKDCVRASIAIPLIIPPINIDGEILCDGGLVNNLPTSVAKTLCPESVILAVDVIGDYKMEKCKFKLAQNILNIVNLTLVQSRRYRPVLEDIYVKITQPDISSISYSQENAKKATKRGVKQTNLILDELKSLLKEKQN